MSNKDENLKREVLKDLENKKIPKKEVKEKLINFTKNLDLKNIVDTEKEEIHTFLGKIYKTKKVNIYAGEIDNSKNKKDPIKIIINKIKIPKYFKNRKIKKVKKMCHQNDLVAQQVFNKDRLNGFLNNGIFVKHHGKTMLAKKTVFGFKKDNIIKKKSRFEIKNDSDFYKNKLIEYVKNTYLKESPDEDYKNTVLNILNNNVLKNIDKSGNIKDFIFKPCEFEIYNGYKNFDLKGNTLNEILKYKKDFSLIIAADTEFINVAGSKNKEECILLSTQFCLYWKSYIYTFTFIVNKIYTSKLSIKTFIQHILKFVDGNLFKINERDKDTNRNLNVTILHHFGRADLQHYKEFYDMFYKGYALQIQSGIDSIKPLKYNIKYQNRTDREELQYKINLTFRDTIGYCAGEKTLARQSSEQFFKKIEVNSDIDKSDMLSYLINYPKEFIDYADTDAICTLELGYKLWGFNTIYAFTMGQAAVGDYINTYIEKILGTTIENPKNLFGFLYNGCYKNDIQTTVNSNGKLESKNIYTHTNISITNNLQYYTNSYHGGLNQCYTRGYYNDLTLDYDLVSAYPSFMSCLPSANMLLPFKEYINIEPTEALKLLEDKKEFNLACAVADYDFSLAPERYKKHSCIAQKIQNNLVFCTTGKNVAIAGAELYRSLKLGVITKLEKLIIPHYIENPIFKFFYENTIKLRNKFKKEFGKKSVQQEAIKLKNNAPYGKTGQGLRESKISSYINKIKTTDNMPSCDLTNPVYASCITSLVRTYLNDVIALLQENNYTVHSVTTDGFITDLIDINILDKLTQNDYILGDFTKKILEVGRDIQHNQDLNSVWEVKHTNISFFNITTRGNFAINNEGVLAAAGAKVLKRFKTREKILHYLLKYNGKVRDKFLKLTTLNDMLINNEILSGIFIYKNDFVIEFDGKNIPLLETNYITKLELKNKIFEVLNFKTRQPKNKEEYLSFKRLLKKYKNATYNKESFYKLMQEFTSSGEIENTKNINTRKTKNNEYTEAKNFLTNYLTKLVNKKIIKYFKSYTRQEIVEFININFLEFNNKKLTKNVFENIQKQIKKIEDKEVIKKLDAGGIENKILEYIKSKK